MLMCSDAIKRQQIYQFCQVTDLLLALTASRGWSRIEGNGRETGKGSWVGEREGERELGGGQEGVPC